MEFRALEKKYPDCRFYFTSKDELSIADPTAIDQYFSDHSFSHCINCAAYTAVDLAETEKKTAFQINSNAAGYLAAICKKMAVQFIHISTDYVFDGNGITPYKESYKANPVNMYGETKFQGEQEIFKNNKAALIFRTSWVYSIYGKNFVKTMAKLMTEKDIIGVVNDQVGSPTYAADLANTILTIISGNESPVAGIYHYCNEGVISWFDFAMEIKRLIGSNCQVNPIATKDYSTPAKRPQYSVLDTSKIRQTFGITIPDWKQSLKKCIDKLLPTV